jgi:ABC-type transport system involved in multi-copper enzyme maturation permease subunit
MIATIALFELRQRLKMLSTYVYFAMFFSLAMLWMAAAGGFFSGSSVSFGNKVFINAPFAIAETVTILGYLGIVIVAAMMGRAVQQDFEYDMHHFFFSAPIQKHQYLLGRFLGAYLTLFGIFTSIGLGTWLGTLLPGMSAELIGPVSPLAYVLPYLFTILPNLFVFGAIFFVLAALTRRMLPVYIASVLMLLGYMIAGSLSHDIDNKILASMIDPFGSKAVSHIVEYWSVHEKNTRLIPFEGVYLYNRLFWSGLGLVVLLTGFWRFRFASTPPLRPGKRTPTESAPPNKTVVAIPYKADFSQRKPLRMLLAMTWLNLRETVKNIYFLVILLAGVLFMGIASSKLGAIYGTNTYPVTYAVLELVGGSFSLFIIIITTFYAGELVWREREARIHLMLDATPTPNWLPYLAKLLALISLQALMLLMVMATGMLSQLLKGYTRLEPGLYIQSLFFIQLPTYAMMAVLAIALQVLINNRYIGYFAMIVYYILLVAAAPMGLDHPMIVFGNNPTFIYSDMNGYGHYLTRDRWFNLYWGGAALLLGVSALLLWARGTNDEWRMRMQLARRALSPSVLAAAGLGIVLFGGAGTILFYNINILNRYQTAFKHDDEQANYEKQYKKYQTAPQPRITDVKVAVDIYPDTRRTVIKGHYQLENRSGAPINTIFVQLTDDPVNHQLHFSRSVTPGITDKILGFYSYKLQRPLAAGEKFDLDFDLAFAPKGSFGLGGETPVIGNGTFFNNSIMPSIGYQEAIELSEDRQRKKHGLATKERLPVRDDPQGLANNYISSDADWINFDATVSTSPDQIALAPGYLEKEWQDNGRRYFHYKMDRPILNFYAFQSARYAVKHDMWNQVPIDIYYQPGHEYNLARMIKGVQASLDYYTKNFGPYQHKQVRIVEFPRYHSFAQSFPNTIPFSESIGFIAKVEDNNPKDIDYPFYVTAHEVAHQWWAHQVVAGRTRGATVLSETLSQYSALMVMKHAKGDEKMPRFLRFELDRYLLERSGESKKELPLAQNENQGYIHYRKGSLAMYLLQDLIGEEQVNAALRQVLQRYANQGAPYPSASVLVDALRQVTPADKLYLIDDLFESIVLYENRAISAKAKPAGKGQYAVTISVFAKKVRAGELGEEKEAPLKDWIEIGVNDKDDKPLWRERKLIERNDMTYTVMVKGEPAKAGIDPDNKLIDRKPDDNLIKVEIEGK